MKIPNGLDEFLNDYPGMSTTPYSGDAIRLCGRFQFRAEVVGKAEVEDSYRLEIILPNKFPKELPKVKEIGQKIPRNNGDFHVNPDGSLCLGSPLRLLRQIHNSSKLTDFAEKCLVPYLYAVSYKFKHGGSFIFGELSHGDKGIVDDYCKMFNLCERSQVKQAIELLGIKKRIANKKDCPCGCGRRLGACPFHHKLNKFRKMAHTSWFREQVLKKLNSGLMV